MKKLISLLLVVILICSTLVGCDWKSIFNQSEPTIDEDTKMKQMYLSQFKIQNINAEDVIIDYDGGTYNGARIVMLDAEMNKPVIWSETIAEATIQYYDTNRLYAYKSEKFYTLAEAYANYILYSKDIVSIAEKFNKEVTHFTDTCDKYDFPKGKILELEGSDKEWISCHSYEYIYIYLDIAVYGTGSKDLIEYLGSDSITDIGFIKLRVNHKEFPDYYPMLLCAVLKEQTKECADCAMEEIVQIPGVIGVSYFHPVGFPAEATNNATHSSNEYWWVEEIQVEKVWDFTLGSSSVNVGVIDMGIGSSPELYGKVMTGYDFYYNDTITNDDIECHGTFVAGIIGSNHQYMKGVNQNISLIPLQVDNGTTMSMFDNEIIPIPGFDHDSLLPALNSITENGRFGYLDIINLSLESNNTDLAIYTAIANYNGLFVCGAGNEGNNIDTAPYYYAIYPAKYGSSSLGENELNNMIVVGALDQNGNRWYYTYYESSLGSTIPLGSNYGINTVDIYAPGVDILSIIPIDYCSSKSDIVDSDCGPKRRCECTRSAGNWIFESEHLANGYHYNSGTSFATPMVTGVAALLLSINPELNASLLKECVLGGADNITIMVGDNNDISQPAKKLNAWGAFKYLMNNYYTYELNEMQSISTNMETFTDTIVSIDSYSTFKENTSFIKLEIEDDGHYQFTASADNDIKLCLYDSSYELIISRSTYSETVASAEFLVYLKAGTYYLKTNFTEEITGNGLISFAINFTEETHKTSNYLLYNSTHHRCVCGCGYDMGTEAHTVRLSEVVLGIGHCMYCGARVMLGNDIVQVPGMLNIQRVTVNGSYILPSGIIVLVDEDIEAYENGTLVFYDKDKLPQIQ